MKRKHTPARLVVGVGMAAVLTLSGCQTWFGGMTLPSGHYLQHGPQYFPPSPSFPLSRELSMQERAAAEGFAGPGAAQPLPAPVPAVPGPGDVAPLPPPVP